MASVFQKFLFGSLPPYFKVFDSNKDEHFEGSLERFLSIFHDELDYSYGKIQNLHTLLNSGVAPESHLFILGANFNKPPTIFNSPVHYRKLLKGFRELMSYKGTLIGLEKLFKILGADITITDETPPLSVYDTGLYHDKGVKYDNVYRDFYFISVNILDHENFFTGFDLSDPDFITKLEDLIYFMLPINVFLNTVSITGDNTGTLGSYLIDYTSAYLLSTPNSKLKAD